MGEDARAKKLVAAAGLSTRPPQQRRDGDDDAVVRYEGLASPVQTPPDQKDALRFRSLGLNERHRWGPGIAVRERWFNSIIPDSKPEETVMGVVIALPRVQLTSVIREAKVLRASIGFPSGNPLRGCGPLVEELRMEIQLADELGEALIRLRDGSDIRRFIAYTGVRSTGDLVGRSIGVVVTGFAVEVILDNDHLAEIRRTKRFDS